MFKKCRIVLVDDHEAIRKALCNLLSLYEDMQIVGEAADGKEAIDIVSSCRPDVVVMDINMPRMNGLEAANLMKKSW
jgi:YesN/AraC family two-component response regulator